MEKHITAQTITYFCAFLLKNNQNRNKNLLMNKALYQAAPPERRASVIRYLNNLIDAGNKSAKFIKSEIEGVYYD